MTNDPTDTPAVPPIPLIPRKKRYLSRRSQGVRALPQTCRLYRDELGAIPDIPVRGGWLRELGFAVGSQVRIEGSYGEISLKLVWTRARKGETHLPKVQHIEVEHR